MSSPPFADLLVELRLLLVAEVEEGEEEDRQEEGWEVESGVQGEEVAHMDGMWMTVSEVRARLELEANVSVMKCAKNKTTCARSVVLFVDVQVVKRHAIVDVLCRPVVNVVIGVHIVVLFVPHVVVHFVVLILLVVILYQFIPLFSRSHFSHMFSLYSHGIFFRCGIYTPVGYSRPPSAVNDSTVTKQMNSEIMPRRSVPIAYLSGFHDQSVLGTSFMVTFLGISFPP